MVLASSEMGSGGLSFGNWCSGERFDITFFRHVLLHGFRGSACCRGGRSHARARRCFRCTSNCAPSLAHVLCPVQRGRVFVPRTATSLPRFLTENQRTFC